VDWDAVELLLNSELLEGVPEEVLRTLHPRPELISISAGETLIRQDEVGAAFYLLVYGRLRVFVEDETGVARRVGEVLPGEGVGEMSLLTEDLTSATVRAMHDSDLVRFSRESYIQLMEASPEAALQVTRTVIKRLREGMSGQNRKSNFSTITVLPIDPDIDVGAFIAEFAEQLSQFLPVQTVSADTLDPQHAHLVKQRERMTVDDDHIVSSSLLVLENEPGAVIYQADYELTEWTRISVRQADIILLLSSVDSPTGLTETEENLINHLDPDLAPRTDLVMLHPEEWRAHCGTADWLESRHVDEYHHLRCWRRDDFARLARILTNNAINLVLGGGGARGFAQIGVIRALNEAGIPIDRIGGTSMGSIVGAMHAVGLGFEQMSQLSREIWIEGKPLSDYTFPALSIVRGQRLHNLIKNALSGWQVEDLPISFYCVSGNLTDIDLMLHDSGPLWQGVRASGSIPGAGPPMFLDGKLLVDGGVLNNLPGDIMQNRHGGYVIIVDVSPQEPISVPEDIGETLSGWRILRSRLNPFETALQVPSLFEVLYRTATLSSELMSKVTQQLADILLVPPLERFGTLSFDQIDEIIAVGYRDTVRRLHAVEGPLIQRYLHLENLPRLEEVAEPEVIELHRATPSRSWAKIAAAAVLVLAVGVGGWSYMKRSAAPTSDEKAQTPGEILTEVTQHNGSNILPVRYVSVKQLPGYEVKENYAGQVVTRRASQLGFERSGLLTELKVEEGSRVKAGDVLGRLDTARLLTRRGELRAQLAVSRASLKQTQARMELAVLTTKRRKRLLGQNNVSRQSYDEAFYAEKALTSEIVAREAATTQVSAALETLKLDILKSNILAPFDGTIVDRFADEGVAISAGKPILYLIEDSVKEVRIGIPLNVTANLSVGAQYEVEIGNQTYPVRLKALLATIDEHTRTVPAIFELSDPQRKLRRGQLAQLKFKYTVSMPGFWLPSTALAGGRRGLWSAYVVDQTDQGNGLGKLESRELQMLHSEADRIYVRGTLRDGEAVVASGLHRLVPGQIVTLKAADATDQLSAK